MALLRVINSTISYQVENIAQIPVVMSENDKPEIDMLVKQNISLAKKDWDFFETSWCFSRHPLIKNNDSLISKAYETWSAELDEMTYKTYKNEARITEIFARIYKISNQELQYVEDRETTMAASSLRIIKELNTEDIKAIMMQKDNPIAFWNGDRWDSFDEAMSDTLWGY